MLSRAEELRKKRDLLMGWVELGLKGRDWKKIQTLSKQPYRHVDVGGGIKWVLHFGTWLMNNVDEAIETSHFSPTV